MKKIKIFISYSSKDSAVAEELHRHLDAAGFDVWRDQERLETDWSQEIAFALAGSDVLCLLWSEHAANSKWVRHEWLTARALEKRIIPCPLSKAPDLPDLVHNLHGVSFLSADEGSQQLVERIKGATSFTVLYDYTVLPKNSYIPYNPNPHFTGRHMDLLDLYLKMIGNLNKIGINQVGMVGMGGIGKSQLAVEFALRFSYNFDAVYWIQAANPGTWLREYVSIARDRLKLVIERPDKAEADKQYLYALQAHFRRSPGTLVIMDNVVEPKLLNNETYLLGLTPLTLGCELLFTTRKHFYLEGVSSQTVDVLSAAAAYALLTSYRKPETIDEEKHARSVCNMVGNLPLAITLAGAYLRKYKDDYLFADYREELAEKKLDVIDIDEVPEENLATRHVAAVSATLESQWAMLKDENARYLFKLAGQFPEAAIIPKARMDLLSAIKKGKTKLDRPIVKAFNNLHEICLMERLEDDMGYVRLHPLVRDFSFNLVTDRESTSFKKTAAVNLKNAYFNYRRLDSELHSRGVEQVIDDLQTALQWWGKDDEEKRSAYLLHEGIHLSSHVLLHDPSQLSAQLTGRLLNEEDPGIVSLIAQTREAKREPWLCPLQVCLTSPGGSIQQIFRSSRDIMWTYLFPDNKRLLSGAMGALIEIWNIQSGRKESEFVIEQFRDYVIPKYIFRNGKKVVFKDRNYLGIWNLEKGEEVWVIDDTTRCRYHGVHVSKDESRLIYWTDSSDFIKIISLKDRYVSTLNICGSNIIDLKVFSDDQRLVSWHSDSTIRLWDVNNGTHRAFPKQDTRTRGVHLCENSERMISWSEDGQLLVWDIDKNDINFTLDGHLSRIVNVYLFRNEDKLMSWSWDGTIKIWNLRNKKIENTFEHGNRYINKVIVSESENIALSESSGREIRIWDLTRRKLIYELESAGLKGLHLFRDGRHFLVGTNQDIFYCTVDGIIKKSFKKHSEYLRGIEVLPDEREFFSFARDSTIIIWNLENDISMQNIVVSYIDHIYVVEKHGWIVSSSTDGRILFNQIEDFYEKYSIQAHRSPIFGLRFPSEGNTFFSWAQDGIKAWDIRTKEMIYHFDEHQNHLINGIEVIEDIGSFISWSYDRTIKIWDYIGRRLSYTLRGHDVDIHGVRIYSNGQNAVSWAGSSIKVWDLNSGRECYSFDRHSDWVMGVQLYDNERKAISWSRDSIILMWDVLTGSEIFILEGHADRSELCVKITRDGIKVLSWCSKYDVPSKDYRIKIWDVCDGKIIGSFNRHNGEIKGVYLFKDNVRIMSWSLDKSLRIWNVVTGEEVFAITGHNKSVRDVILIDNEKKVISWDIDNELKLWDLDKQVCIATFTFDFKIVYCEYVHDKIIVSDKLGGLFFLTITK